MSKTSQLVDRDSFHQMLNQWDESVPLTLAATDIDEFHPINQGYGREVGDKVIALVQKTLEQSLTGLVARTPLVTHTGGDEFACALPGLSPEEALIQLEEIRQFLANKQHDFGGVKLPVRLSIGIANFPQHVQDPKDLIKAVDEALMRAKREGRGKIAIYVEDKMVLKSNYYSKAQLARLSTLSERLGRTEAALLREALLDLLDKYRGEL